MSEHYIHSFYDDLDDLLHLLGSTLYDIEENKESILADTQNEIPLVTSLLQATSLDKSLSVLDSLIQSIASSIREESKAYSDIDELVKNDTVVLQECKTDIESILYHIEAEQKLAEEYQESLVDHIEEKLGDTNIIILDTFYS